MKRLVLIGFFLTASAASAVITPGAHAGCYAASTCTTAAISVSAGDAILIAVYTPTTNVLVPITNSCGQTFTGYNSGVTQNGNLNVYIAFPAVTGSCTFTSTISGQNSISVQDYSGVGQIGTPVLPTNAGGAITTGSGTCPLSSDSALASLSLAAQPGNYVVGLFAGLSGTNQGTTFGATSPGTFRVATPGQAIVSAISDITTTVASNLLAQLTISQTTTQNATCNRSAVLLTQSSTPPPAALGFSANPPIVAGTGITVTGTPTAIVIALASLRAAGQAMLGGSPIRAGGCVVTLAHGSHRILLGDHIAYSLATDPEQVSHFSDIRIRASPSRGDARFEVCNRTSRLVTPGRFSVNWHAVK